MWCRRRRSSASGRRRPISQPDFHAFGGNMTTDKAAKADEYFAIYRELIGFVPPRIQERVKLGLDVDPGLLDQVEALRASAMYPKCFDTKTAQLILFAVLLDQISPASEYHARGAVRAGA